MGSEEPRLYFRRTFTDQMIQCWDDLHVVVEQVSVLKMSVVHLFFECAVAKVIWGYVKEYLGLDIGSDYLSVASKWLQKEKCYGINIISSVVLSRIWLIRNDFIFNNQGWVDVKQILRRMF
jgi:hypothetical protein